MAKRDLLPPELALWLPFAVLLAGTAYLLLRALRGRRPVIPIFGRAPQPAARATA
jgi:hypothetical protein